MGNNFTSTSAASVAFTGHGYTLAALQSAVAHALGGTPSSTTSTANIVNDAVNWLCQYHPWSWLKKALSLNLTSGQTYIALPADFKAVHTAVRNGAYDAVIPTTLEQIHLLRANSTVAPSWNIWYAISITSQATVTVAPLYRMEIYPTPTTNATAAIIGTYLKQVRKLSGSTDLPDIPAPWHPALKSLCRAMAISEQFREDSDDWMQAKALLDALVAMDGAVQPSLGPMRGAVRRGGWDHDCNNLRGTITTP